jgi:hypothetical protein
MQQTRRWNRRVTTIAAALAVTLASVGVAAATIPDGGGTISACYKVKNGVVRVIDTSKTPSCAAGENGISWNQQGAPGAPGAAGPQGPQGGAGPAGAPGSSGITGYEVITVQLQVPNLADRQLVAWCSPGKRVISGGFRSNDGNALVITRSHSFGTGWEVYFHNGDLFTPHTGMAYAICGVIN